VIPAKKEPIRSRVPLRRFRYDIRHDILKCPKGRILRPTRRGLQNMRVQAFLTAYRGSSQLGCRPGGSLSLCVLGVVLAR
jgi:hypothetical protein